MLQYVSEQELLWVWRLGVMLSLGSKELDLIQGGGAITLTSKDMIPPCKFQWCNAYVHFHCVTCEFYVVYLVDKENVLYLF